MQSSDRALSPILPIATLLSIIAAIAVNAIANISPPSGLTIGEISNTILAPVLITPANYAFIIWGLIYVGAIAFGIYQVLPSQINNARWQQVRAGMVAASVLQMIWVYLFTFKYFWCSVAIMVGILLSLIVAFLSIQADDRRIYRQEKWLVKYPISVYFGWISVATAVNIASALFASGWNGGGLSPAMWTAIVLLVTGAIAVSMYLKYSDTAYILVFIWAWIAIAIRQSTQPPIFFTAIVLAIGFGILLLISNLRAKPKLL